MLVELGTICLYNFGEDILTQHEIISEPLSGDHSVSVDENFVVTTLVVCLKKRLKSSLQAQIFIYWVYERGDQNGATNCAVRGKGTKVEEEEKEETSQEVFGGT